MSFTEIDFSILFTPWTSYAVERIHAGEIPLWNPYMYSGTSFLTDPQNVIFYPLRWVTIAGLAFDPNITNSDVLFALELEMIFHVFLGTVLMYLYLKQHLKTSSSLVGAIIWGYGGYMTSYPPAQLPILETAIWIPLVLIGIDRIRQENDQIKWQWVLLSGSFFGLSILAGHTQTSMLTGYLAISYMVYRLWGLHWRKILSVLILWAIIAVGLSAIQILPTLEFQQYTTRAEFGFEEKGVGFAWHEIGMMLFPRTLGVWVPLYVGIISLGLIGIGIWRQKMGYWVGVSVVAFALAFGKKTVIYTIFYLLVPGFTFFRYQERATMLLIFAVAVIASYGTESLVNLEWKDFQKRYLIRAWVGLIVILGVFTAVFWFERLGKPNSSIENIGAQSSTFSFFLALISLVIFWQLLAHKPQWQWAVVALIVFDLFSITMNSSFNYDRKPVSEQLQEPAYVEIIRDNTLAGQTVDGQRGIGDSYGALYRIPDTFGTGPLRLQAIEFYLYGLEQTRRWEILGVQVVTSGNDDLPVPNTWLGQGQDKKGLFYIYQIQNQRPFALLYYEAEKVDSPEAAWERVADPALDLRHVVIVEHDIAAKLGQPATNGYITATVYEPEYIELKAATDQPAIAGFALPYAPGWHASVDGEDVEILRTYGGMTGIYLDEGEHTIVLRYLPDTLIVGAIITGLTLAGVLVGLLVLRQRERHAVA